MRVLRRHGWRRRGGLATIFADAGALRAERQRVARAALAAVTELAETDAPDTGDTGDSSALTGQAAVA